ncbi:response regulator transcription factor [Noviherbaspirillum massiliense]|uniref:response regulator transcription factor n=1 Tax=Noviherbaspirillum massiliense TaxID=1465823 RepID=UPI0002E32272|nr:response regulator transcription factor [Noviherbaspirillum massiliense]
MKIAVLSDQPDQTALLCDVLAATDHACQAFATGKELVAALHRERADMLVLDWQATDGSAADVLAWARANMAPEVPILLVAGRSAEEAVASALAAGASDYIVSPVRRGELRMRTQVLLRRAYPAQAAPEQIRFGPYLFEKPTGRLTVGGRPVELTQKEFDLALLFFRNLGRPLSRAYIQEAVWTREAQLPTRTVDTHVSRVRSKLHLRPENGFQLTPVYSYGYRLEQLAS